MCKSLEISIFKEKFAAFSMVTNPKVHYKSSHLFEIMKVHSSKNILILLIKGSN